MEKFETLLKKIYCKKFFLINMSRKGLSWFQRKRIQFRIFFDNDKLGLKFFTKEEREYYKKSNCFKKLWIRKKDCNEKTNMIDHFLKTCSKKNIRMV